MNLSRPAVGEHPTPEDLMCLLDGELAANRAAAVECHLSSCPECRETLARFSGTASCFSSEVLFPEVENSPSEIPAQVKASRPQIPISFGGLLPLRAGFRFSGTVAAGIALLLMAALLQHLVLSPVPVSARGLVQTARAGQGDILRQYPARSIRRKLKLTKLIEKRESVANGVPTIGKTEFWETLIEASATQEILETESATALEIAAAMPRVACRSLVPLSLDMLECLLDAEELTAVVRESNTHRPLDAYEIEFSNAASNRSGSFASSWTLRSSDWRLTEVVYRVGEPGSVTVYRIVEEEYSLIPVAPIESSRTETPGPERADVAKSTPVAPVSHIAHASAAVRKLRAFEILSEFGMTPEDDLHVALDSSGAVRIEGIVPDPARQARIRLLVSPSDEIDINVLSYDEAVARLAPAARTATNAEDDRDPPPPVAEAPATVRSEGPLLADLLAAHFGNDDAGQARASRFGGTILSEAQQLLFEARWVERLRTAIPAEAFDELNRSDQRRFLALQADSLNRLQQRHRRLNAIVSGVLCPNGCPDSERPGTAERSPTPSTGGDPDVSWIPILNHELALLKTMFVDRDFESVDSASEAVSAWRGASRHVETAVESSIVRPAAEGTQATISVPGLRP